MPEPIAPSLASTPRERKLRWHFGRIFESHFIKLFAFAFREASGGAVVIFLSKKRKFIALYIDFWELWGAGDCQLEVARSATAEVVES